MKIFTEAALKRSAMPYPDARTKILEWRSFIEPKRYDNPNQLKLDFPDASIISTPGQDLTRVIFNIRGNHYRLAVDVNFQKGGVLVVWFGTHSEYDRIDFTRYQRPPY